MAWLDDLSSAFPAHAGHSVRESLRRWQQWASETGEHAGDAEVWPLLRRQGDLWRALLSGEKLGVDMLEVDNSLDAADRAFDQMRSLVGRFVRRFPIVAIIAALLFVAGVVLVVVGASSASVTRPRRDHRQRRPDLARHRRLARAADPPARAPAVGRGARRRDH